MSMIQRLFLLCSLSVSAMAFGQPQEFANSLQEQRYHNLLFELRCVVCQNQNIAESNVELAQKLRAEVKKQILSGADDEAIKQYLVDRYGEFVLYKPRLGGKNSLLWILPVALVTLAILAIWRIRRKGVVVSESQLTAEQQARVDRLMKGGE